MYRTLDVGWTEDPKVRRLSRDGKLLFVYLIANRLSHVSGIYHLPDVMVEHALGLPRRALDTLWDTLSKEGLALRDADREVVFVRCMFRHQGRGEKNHRAAAAQLETLHNSRLISDFLVEYPVVRRYLSDTLCDTLSRVGVQEQEQERDQEQEQENVRTPEDAGFEDWWREYPKKVGKLAALAAWKATKRERPPLPAMLATLRAQRESADWTEEGGRFIVAPERYLKRGRWSDDVASMNRGGNGAQSTKRTAPYLVTTSDGPRAVHHTDLDTWHTPEQWAVAYPELPWPG